MPQIAQQDYIRINVSSSNLGDVLSGDALTAVKNAVANKTILDVIFCITDSEGEVVGEARALSVDFANRVIYLGWGEYTSLSYNA